MFLERFRNVVQAIVNKKSHFFRPSAEGCTLQGVLFNFQDLCGEGGLDAEHLLLCGPPNVKLVLCRSYNSKHIRLLCLKPPDRDLQEVFEDLLV